MGTMNILIINGSCRAAGTTAQLARAFSEGVEAAGATAEMVMLRDHTIAPCTNCLKCYAWEGDGPAPCSLHDAVDGLLERLAAADGILFASPVHSGFVSGLMTLFHERITWRTLRPGPPMAGMASLQSRLDDKVRALGSIASAGGMPERLRSGCDDGTRWLKGNLPLEFHGQWIGDQYAGADLERMPENDRDWKRLYLLRRISPRQLDEARALGRKMVRAIRRGRLKPVTMQTLIPRPVQWILSAWSRFSPHYRLAPRTLPNPTP
jgi:multimeric flavodoxin WrbA